MARAKSQYHSSTDKSARSRMAGERTLWAAWSHVAGGTGMPGVDGVTPERYATNLASNLRTVGDLLRDGNYRPQPLRPATVNRNGKERNLGIPTVRDRVVQRAFLETFFRELDVAAADSSFAYRKGRSYLDALAITERCRDSGLRSVFRGDIKDFFNQIDHDHLRSALRPVIRDDALLEMVMGWVAAPLLTPNGLEVRHRGIPLGAPVSPALANRFLSKFDKALHGSRGALVRYADDFAIFCADDDTAVVAGSEAGTELRSVDLELRDDKTYVSNFAHGFSFLGWVFFRDHGYEESPQSNWVHPMTKARSQTRAFDLTGRPKR